MLKRHEGGKPHSFSRNTYMERSCSNVTFVTIAVFKLILKRLKDMKEGNLIVFLAMHTWKEAVPT